MQFEKYFNSRGFILTEGAIVERLKNEFNVTLNRHINHAGLIYDNPGIMSKIYQEYIGIAHKFDIPIMLINQQTLLMFRHLMRSILSRYPNSRKEMLISFLRGSCLP